MAAKNTMKDHIMNLTELSPRACEYTEEEMHTFTPAQIMAIEPLLHEIAKALKQYNRHKGFCANAIWYGHGDGPSYNKLMAAFVGWYARHPALKTSHAYDVMYHYLYELLPDCKHHGGIC